MGVYKAAVVTESGQNLIAQAFTSEKKLIFTSAKTSSYSYPAGTNISALTGLQDVVQSVIPSGTKTIGGNVAQVTVRFDNDSIDQAYLIQTIGLYAKIEDGEEILFSVTQATVPDEMPVHSEVSPSAYIYNIQSTVQNASQITITVNPTGAASVQDFLDIQNPTFDDSGTSEEISSFPEFLDTVKSKMNFFQFFRNLKSGLQFVLHVGSIVNNCVTDNPNLPLSAAQGKALQDQLATLNSNLEQKLLYTTDLLPVQAVFGREVVSTTGKTGSIDLSKYIPAGRTHYSFCIVSSEGSHPLYSIVQDNKLVVNMIDSTASTTFVVNFMIFVH